MHGWFGRGCCLVTNHRRGAVTGGRRERARIENFVAAGRRKRNDRGFFVSQFETFVIFSLQKINKYKYTRVYKLRLRTIDNFAMRGQKIMARSFAVRPNRLRLIGSSFHRPTFVVVVRSR